MEIREEIDNKILDNIFGSVKELSAECTQIVQEKVNSNVKKELKKDQTFVTEIDFAVEDYIRNFVQNNFPDHGILGEEREDILPDADFQWITDPIDGTQNLVHGIPTYGIVIGVHYKGRPIAGSISHPMLDMNYSGAFKKGAYFNNQRIQIQDDKTSVDSLNPQEVISLGTRQCFERTSDEKIFDKIMTTHPSTRVYYDIFATSRVVHGQIGAFLEFGMKMWDIAASEILLTEAGGDFEILKKADNPDGSRNELVCAIGGKPSVVKTLKNML